LRCSAVTLLCCLSLVANAELLYRQDFEGDSARGWRDSGTGSIRFTEYAGNTTLRLSNTKTATLSLSTSGYEQVKISMQMAAGGLGRRDACYSEVSADGGRSWKVVVEVRDGKDDSVTLYYGQSAAAELSNNPDLRIRFRAATRRGIAYCWGDNVTVEGRAAGRAHQNALTTDFLFSDGTLPGPVDYSAFSAVADAEPIDGTAVLNLILPVETADSMRSVVDPFGYESAGGPTRRSLPAANLLLLQVNGQLIPSEQATLVTENAYWDIGFRPGVAWRDTGAEANRFALPFALYEKNANCTHNGVITWASRDDGEVSRAAYQVASETCPYFKFDLWGTADIDVTAGELEEPDELLRAFEAERNTRFEQAALEELVERYPSIDIGAFGSVGDMNPEDMSVYGLLVDGTHYRSKCTTRYGNYPYCSELLLPSYSTAKSIVAGLALMQLEERFPGSAELTVADLVPECRNRRWEDVTLENLVDMASGNYDSAVYDRDERAVKHIDFLYAATHDERIRAACRNYPRKSKPGERWVYRTSDTYIAGTAMRAALAARLGRDVDIYEELLVQPILRPLGVSPSLEDTRRSLDEYRQPLTGWGLSMLVDDALRIADWLQTDGGFIDGERVLDERLYEAAMQRTETDRGLEAVDTNTRYNNGFWSLDISTFIGCERPVHVPFMSGHGGIVVALFPNGIIYYYFSDGYRFRWREAAVEVNEIKSMCQ